MTAGLDRLRPLLDGCHACALRSGGPVKVSPVFGRGSSEAKLVIVGEAPGPTENAEGRPFIGPSGAILACLMEQAGIDPGAVWITNAVRCWPHRKGVRRPETIPPTAGQVKTCASLHLDPQLVAIPARVIVTLGATAAAATFGRGHADIVTMSRKIGPDLAFSPANIDGPARVHTWRGLTIYAAYHPAFLARRNYAPGADAEQHTEARTVLRTLKAAWATANASP